MTGYVRKFDDNSTMSFKINNKQLLKKTTKYEKNLKSLLKIKFDREPVYGDNDKYIKTKTYGASVITNFQSKKLPKEKAPCKSLSIIMLDSVVKAKKKYYPQTFLEECKYEAKKIKMENLDDLEKRQSDESDNYYNDETASDNEKYNDESNE